MSNVLDSINALLKQGGKEDEVNAQKPDETESAQADPGEGKPKLNPQNIVAQSLTDMAAGAAAQQPTDVTPPSTGPLVSSDPTLIDNPMQHLGAISQSGIPFFPGFSQLLNTGMTQSLYNESFSQEQNQFLHQYMMQQQPPGTVPPGMQVLTYPHQLASYPGIEAPYGHPSQDEGPKRAKKATRRGPMDEMRQLIRILIKIFPQSVKNLGHDQEAGGGNRISEDQIKNYIRTTLGEGGDNEPQVPEWGVPQGWGEYLAELFAWGTGKEITADQARRCAKREPGRSWESVKSELDDMGVHPDCWPLPLKQDEVRAAEENPVPVKVPRFAPPPASAGGGGAAVNGGAVVGEGVPASAGKRTAGTGTTNGTGIETTAAPANKRYKTAQDKDYRKMNEIEIWEHLVDVVEHIKRKANTHVDMHRVARVRGLGMQCLHSLPYWSELYTSMDLAGGGEGGGAAAAAAAAGGGMLPPMSMEVLQAMGIMPPGTLPFGGSVFIKKEEVEGESGNTATKQAGKSSKARGDLFGALGGSDGSVPNPMTLQTLAAQGYGATTMHPELFKLFMVQQQAAAAAAASGGDQQQQQEEEKAGGEKAFQPNLGKLQ